MECEYSSEGIGEAAQWVMQAAGKRKVLAFNGEMGAGKTTLIHALCRTLGVTGPMSSPTFSIINEYGSERGTIYHMDLYRCHNEEEAVRAGVEECLFSGSICLVEWPSRAESLFPDDTLWVTIRESSATVRKIILRNKE